jgi:hypothetical protein
MESTDRSGVVVGLLVGAMFLGFLWLSPREKEVPNSEPAAVNQDSPIAEPADAYDSVSASTPAEPQTPLRASPGTAYECLKDGQRVFSDYPCGDDAKTRDVTPQNVYVAPRYSQRQPAVIYNPQRQTGAAEKDNEDCTHYEDDVKRIDARMRSGYTSAESERLREQRRRAAAARDDCQRRNRIQ